MEPPYQHQVTAKDLLWRNGVFALIMEQGTGKSRPVIEDWLARIQAGIKYGQDLVVLAPKGCYLNWTGTEEDPGELMLWVPPEIYKELNIGIWRSGANVSQRRALKELLFAIGPRFLSMNIEALNRDGSAREYLMNFVKDRSVIGVIDESTTIAHEEAARTKFILRKLADRFVARRILSGLVAPESPMNLYSQYYFLDWRIIGSRSFFGFRNRYAVTQRVDFRPMAQRQKEGAVPEWKKATTIVGFRNLDELNQKIMTKSYRVTKDQVLDLPPKIYQFWDVELTPEQERAYIDMRDMAMAGFENDVFSTATIKLDQLGKMQHILCGHVRTEDGGLVDIPENRTDAVVQILRQHSGKAIIWAPYPRALEKIVFALKQEFGDESVVGFWGETSLDDRLEARARIQGDERCRFIASNQSVGKFGNTWTSCNLVIYYANSFDNEDRQQSEDRAHRIGQTRSVTYIDLRARGTLDEKLIKVLRKKITISSTLQGDEFKQWLI